MVAPQPGNRQATPQEIWLRASYSGEWFEVIERRGGGEWVSVAKPYKLKNLLLHLADESKITGIRPEKKTRSIICDIDCKEKYHSKYWRQYGKSKELIELEKQVESIGGILSILRSSHSGGLHAVISLPEAIPCWLAHWLGRWLLGRSGMAAEAGQAELFPSRINFSADGRRQRSHGFRLPGQKGSALIAGNRFIEDTEIIYQQLISDLDNTKICPEWRKALASAKQLRPSSKQKLFAPKINTASTGNLEWTGQNQSNDLLQRITTQARLKYRKIEDVDQLANIIYKMAINLKGYEKHASDTTKRDLAGWCKRCARSSLSKPFYGKAAIEKNTEGKHRNEYLKKLAKSKLTKLAKQGQEVKSWSKRQIAKAAGMARVTLEKHWDYWVQLVAYTPPNNGVGREGPQGSGSPKGQSNEIKSKVTCKYEEIYFYCDEIGCFIKKSIVAAFQNLATDNFYVQALAPP